MQAAVLRGPHDIGLEDVPRPVIEKDTDVIVRVTATAICTSDVHYADGFLPIEEPIRLGHEFVGVVDEVGGGVRTLKRGDRVAVAPYAWCGACSMCRRGQESWCPHGALFGSGKGWGDLAGGLSEYTRVINADTSCIPIPDGIPDEHAVLAGDVFGTGFFAVEQCELQPGQTIAVFGAGPIGLSAVQSAALRSPARIFLVDILDSRLELGLAMGATDVINSGHVDPVEEIRRATDGGHPFLSGVDAAADCVGIEVTVDRASKSITKGGILSIVGVPHPGSFGIDLQAAQLASQTIKVGMTPQRNMARILGLMERGRIDVAPFVTHVMELKEFDRAFSMFAGHEDGCLKVVLRP
ncbi:alcohol dehydrogenase catalytic domain-containing protein [Microbacterium betulae]|uniref:Alcohol dehydrogenase catalytic domain-containing protein n=1 Tax=Microbacterium betulae TaxID=2981139 RepID=A0AA97FG53_9MICO|nr:alcohol dehydrogenase catalytic domain-containing protein [Microbacterium sp. AB]WOF22856.1 alcohol dehydrogenase catalytic domain-containing protein [Microbacterium sp. AB]